MTTNASGDASDAQAFLTSLTRELFQTETSAARHCRREADRLGESEPALALRAVADHADAILSELPGLAERNGMPISKGGKMTGALFSQLRDKMFDMLIDSDRSYRGTLLGCRHGLDVVRMLQHLACEMGKPDLDAFCAAWLNTRTVLVQKVEDELKWFAKNPHQALKFARPLVASGRGGRTHAHS
jgi:hypothetical protein